MFPRMIFKTLCHYESSSLMPNAPYLSDLHPQLPNLIDFQKKCHLSKQMCVSSRRVEREYEYEYENMICSEASRDTINTNMTERNYSAIKICI